MVGVALALALLEEVVLSLRLRHFAEILFLILRVPAGGLDLGISQSNNVKEK